MSARGHLTQKRKLELHLKQHGKCADCGDKLITALFEYDHIQDLQFSGDNELDNWQILCTAGKRCHQKKTRAASKASSHVDRIAVGGKQRKGRPMPGSRDSPFKKLMSGEVVRR